MLWICIAGQMKRIFSWSANAITRALTARPELQSNSAFIPIPFFVAFVRCRSLRSLPHRFADAASCSPCGLTALFKFSSVQILSWLNPPPSIRSAFICVYLRLVFLRAVSRPPIFSSLPLVTRYPSLVTRYRVISVYTKLRISLTGIQYSSAS